MLFYKKRNMLCYNIICGIMKKRNRKDKIFMVLDRENKFIGFLEGSDKNSVKTRLKELKNEYEEISGYHIHVPYNRVARWLD